MVMSFRPEGHGDKKAVRKEQDDFKAETTLRLVHSVKYLYRRRLHRR